ncbi:F-box protein skip19 [Thalictrum thalictroides]|nr:F-box protein skip19 [Thalictrum thalictroides]
MSDVTDRMVMKHVESLKMLTTLDISNCNKITCKGLETLGKCCTSLVHLKRNMPPQQLVYDIGSVAKKDDEEALVIADTMRSLRSLELGYGCMTDLGLDAILTKCENLIHLDILGCYGVKLEGDLEDRCNQLTSFKTAWEEEYQDDDDDDEDEDESSEEGNEYFSESDSDSDGV